MGFCLIVFLTNSIMFYEWWQELEIQMIQMIQVSLSLQDALMWNHGT